MKIKAVFEGKEIELDTEELSRTGLFVSDELIRLGTVPESMALSDHINMVAQEAVAPDVTARTPVSIEEGREEYQTGLEIGIARATEMLAKAHQHKFTYALNNNHTALRGCECGLSFATLLAGPDPNGLVWHQIHEAGETTE